jgi:hypothetical protein
VGQRSTDLLSRQGTSPRLLLPLGPERPVTPDRHGRWRGEPGRISGQLDLRVSHAYRTCTLRVLRVDPKGQRCFTALLQSPLTESNRGPLLYEGGPVGQVTVCCGVGSWWSRGMWVSSSAHLSIASWWEDKAGWEARSGSASPSRDRHAVMGAVAPAGAKGRSWVSMCQIASASRRARSTWATLGPRCLPSRARVRW